MKRDAFLKVLLAAFLMYLAMPYIREMSSSLSALFWACWIGFFLLVVGANLGILINVRERSPVKKEEVSKVFMKQN
ncbi:hypothetical protein [Salirhabdus sp. Marseille-P4669]|uniref:hypothetical protein n=1 Tax=Salirhabdus sp. Marseille-P4669 TaxID=2042310 RepID=UPI000C7E6D24|nr:hypothetical protein [Salirhabdus sp. Marseille-P4669]